MRAAVLRGASAFQGLGMKVFAGLGNPGAKYARNRHNIGFMAVDAIAAAHGFGPWRARFKGQTAEGRLGAEKVLLLKPETYMNLSGEAVQAALAFYKLTPADLVVFHDELDLAPGKVRVKSGGGHAGHNGLRSIDAHLGPDFVRVRLGIGHPGDKARVTGHVLGDFGRDDEGWLDDLMRGIADGAPALAEGDAARFLNAVALRTAPPRSSASANRAAPAPTEPATQEADTRTLLQRLADRFR
jgi:PTH1 family peptidyl-tRNA hydrolase